MSYRSLGIGTIFVRSCTPLTAYGLVAGEKRNFVKFEWEWDACPVKQFDRNGGYWFYKWARHGRDEVFARERFEKHMVFGYYSSRLMYSNLYTYKDFERNEEAMMSVSGEELQAYACTYLIMWRMQWGSITKLRQRLHVWIHLSFLMESVTWKETGLHKWCSWGMQEKQP